jgi:D-3-phosphoglycerate dehydrogenase
MKNTAWIVNTSRGGIINEQDLVYALKNDLIRGAAMDVFEHEPLAFGSELTKLSNVVLTPHAASITDEAFRQMMDCCVDNILSYSRGLGCCNLVK